MVLLCSCALINLHITVYILKKKKGTKFVIKNLFFFQTHLVFYSQNAIFYDSNYRFFIFAVFNSSKTNKKFS